MAWLSILEARKAAEAGAAYDAATVLADEGKHDEAEAAFAKLAADGTAGYRMLARLREAAELGERDPKAAVAAYDAIAVESAGQPLMGDLAAVRAGLAAGGHRKFDEMTQRLEPLTQPDGRVPPYRARIAGAVGMAQRRYGGGTAMGRRREERSRCA